LHLEPRAWLRVEYPQLHRDFVEFFNMLPEWRPTLPIPRPEFVGYSLNIEMQLAEFRKWRFHRLVFFHPTMVRLEVAILPAERSLISKLDTSAANDRDCRALHVPRVL
jgi:hypothetical protein